MSLSSPYSGSGGQSPLGGPAVFGQAPQSNWWQPQGGGSFSSASAPQAGASQAPPDITAGASPPPPAAGSAQAPPSITAAASPAPVVGSVQAPSSITAGAAPTPQAPVMGSAQAPSGVTDPTSMMVNALANPAPAFALPGSAAPRPSGIGF